MPSTVANPIVGTVSSAQGSKTARAKERDRQVRRREWVRAAGQNLHEQGVIAVQREQQRGRLEARAREAVRVGELLDLFGRVVHVVAADLGEEDLPLIEERQRLGMLRGDDGVVKGVYAGDGDGAFACAEIAGEVLRRERLALLPQVERAPTGSAWPNGG
jgi:hypothetical protein